MRKRLPLLHSVLGTWHSHAFLPLQPLPTTWGKSWQVSALRTQFRRNETTIKRRWRETGKWGWNPYHTRGSRKSSSDRADDQSSLVNSAHPSLIVKNTVLTVVHTLKPSFLTHSLQIYCIRLTSPRSHTPWTWAAKRVPTKFISKSLPTYVSLVLCSSKG